MRIKTNQLRAASVCVSVRDPRPALAGIHITSKYVEATNGHVAIRMEHSARVRKSTVIKIHGRLPLRAEETELKLGIGEPIAIHYDRHGLRCGVSMVDIINSAFPSIDKVIEFTPEEGVPAFACCYLAYPSKMFKGYFHGAKLKFNGERKPAFITFSREVREKYGNPLFIVMPQRQVEGDFIV
ncbi:hypothetical protein [Leminorella grimontii]|uniref:hypothetical protein n=1 Tax=Leminorella grimontii TaxID=82981 RepID=UPI002089D486|nr:hypothetical protein [Leminorella grimontii]GKX58370.1 hypothetical protein SOASR031_06850 [Leminorella grimontii]